VEEVEEIGKKSWLSYLISRFFFNTAHQVAAIVGSKTAE
jgi:hypothetical protein